MSFALMKNNKRNYNLMLDEVLDYYNQSSKKNKASRSAMNMPDHNSDVPMEAARIFNTISIGEA